MLKQEDIQKIGEKLLAHGQTDWQISSDLQLVGMASGKFQIQDGNNSKIELKDLSESQEKTIREELSLGEGAVDFDTNPFIPTLGDESSVLQDSKVKKPEEEPHDFDKNFLIPSDDECGSPVVDGSIADRKNRKSKEDKIDWDKNFLIPD